MYLNTTIKIPEIKGKIITRKRELQPTFCINTAVNIAQKNNTPYR